MRPLVNDLPPSLVEQAINGIRERFEEHFACSREECRDRAVQIIFGRAVRTARALRRKQQKTLEKCNGKSKERQEKINYIALVMLFSSFMAEDIARQLAEHFCT